MVDVEAIQERLGKLSEFLKLLRKYQPLSYAEYSKNVETELVVERLLQLCTQIVIDIAAHLLAATSHSRPTDYCEAIAQLADIEAIPLEFARRIRGMANFRNILVHGYVEIKIDLVYQNLQEIDDFVLFARYINDWMSKHGLLAPPDAKS